MVANVTKRPQTRYDTDTYIFLARPSLSWGAGEGHADADGRFGQDSCVC